MGPTFGGQQVAKVDAAACRCSKSPDRMPFFDHSCPHCPSQADEQYCDDCAASLERERLALAEEEFSEQVYVERWTKGGSKQYTLWRRNEDEIQSYAIWSYDKWYLAGKPGGGLVKTNRCESVRNSVDVYKVNLKNKYKLRNCAYDDALTEQQRQLFKTILPQE